MSSDLGYPLLMLTRVALAFLMMYVLIPTWLTRPEPPADGVWDRMFAGLINISCLTICVVYVLVFSRLYETFSLLFAYGLASVLLRRRRRARSAAAAAPTGTGALVRMLDITEDRAGVLHGFTRTFRRKLVGWSRSTGRRWWGWLIDPWVLLFPGAIIIWSGIIRLRYALHHAAFSLSDTYEHLAWVKYFGMNQVYQDGIYPQGYHTLISAMHKLTYIDPYWMIRFLGGIGTTILVVAVYHYTLRLTKDHGASLIALAIYGLVSDQRFPSMLMRQQAALPQEFALIFALPALYFLSLYLQGHRRSHLLLFVEAVAITLLVHPYSTLYLLIWAAIQVVVSWCSRQASWREIARLALYGLPATVIGVAPYAIGLLLGKQWFGAAFQFVRDSIGQTGAELSGSWWSRLVAHNLYLDLLLPCAALAALAALLRRTEQRAAQLATAISAVVMLLLYRSADLGLPQLSEVSRTGVFLAPLLAVTCSLGVFALARLLFGWFRQGKRIVPWVTKTAAAVACVLVVSYGMPALPAAEPVEYDAAAANYLQIKTDLPVMDWTIVGPSEQYQQAVGIGWHYDLLRFIQDFSLTDAGDPDFDLPIPTHHIFVFLEKHSLLDGTLTSQVDANQPLEPEGPDPYQQYYRSPSQRALLEAKLLRWMERYRQAHAGVSVYYEDEQLLIYQIEHEIITP